jgi:hypothetical protein
VPESYSEETDWQDHSLRVIEKIINQGFDKIEVKVGGKSISEDQQHIVLIQTLLQV